MCRRVFGRPRKLLGRGDIAGWNALIAREGVVDLKGLRLHHAKMKGICLARANLDDAELVGCDLQQADFTGVSLVEANFIKASLGGANFTQPNCQRGRFDRIDMERASFAQADLRGASFIGTRGERCDFSEGNLSGAIFQAAELSRANFTKAKLIGADLRLADLRLAILVNADLTDAMLGGANLEKASTNGVVLLGTGYLIFTPSTILPEPGSTAVPGADHWDLVFANAEKRAIYAENDLLSARCLTCDMDRGREYQEKYLAEIVHQEGLLTLNQDPVNWVRVENAFGGSSFKSEPGERSTTTIYLFEKCSFEQSLKLMEFLSHPAETPSNARETRISSGGIDWGDESVRQSKLKLIWNFLRDLSARHLIAISEYLRGSIGVQKLDGDSGTWSADVKKAMDFNERVLNHKYDPSERRGYRQMYSKNGFICIG